MRFIQWILNDKIISLFLSLSKQTIIMLSITPGLCRRNSWTSSTQAFVYVDAIDAISVIQITLKPSLTCLAHWLLLHNWWKNSINSSTSQHPSGALCQRSTFIQLWFQPLILFDVFFPVLSFESRLGVPDCPDQLHVWVLDMLVFLLTLEVIHSSTERMKRDDLRILHEVWLLLNWLLTMVIQWQVYRHIFRIDWHHNMFS